MDWFRYIDSYCERIAPGFWAEPLNAISNGAFLLAAAAALIYIRNDEAAHQDRPLWALAVLVAVIGVGSFLFHTFATFWAMLADVIPISIFIYCYLGYAFRRYLGAGWAVTLGVLVVFIAGSFTLDNAVPAHVLNGSVGYLPALGALFAIGGLAASKGHPAGRMMLIAGGTLAVSLVFRSIDNEICASWPSGTHFIWHCLNATLLYVLLRAAANHGRRDLTQVG